MPWVPFTYCEKRSGPTRSKFDALPLHEEATEGLRGIHLLVVAVTTKRLLESATQEKAEVPPSACVRRIGPPYGGLN